MRAIKAEPRVQPAVASTYPERDGGPVAETDVHIEQLLDLRQMLDWYFRDNPQVYVSGNLPIYYVEGEPNERIAPDVFVVFGVPKGQRRVYKVWEEGKGPDVVFEITSRSTRREDLGEKKVIYADLGVREYFLFDPLNEYLTPPLQGFRLTPEGYMPMSGEPLVSEVLGLILKVEEGQLRLYDPHTGQRVLTYREAQAAAAAAEAEIARLRAELERLRGGKPATP